MPTHTNPTPTVCEVIDEAQIADVAAKLGPDRCGGTPTVRWRGPESPRRAGRLARC